MQTQVIDGVKLPYSIDPTTEPITPLVREVPLGDVPNMSGVLQIRLIITTNQKDTNLIALGHNLSKLVVPYKVWEGVFAVGDTIKMREGVVWGVTDINPKYLVLTDANGGKISMPRGTFVANGEGYEKKVIN